MLTVPTPASMPADPAPAAPWPLLAALLLAASAPTLLAINQPPSATLLNQCLALALWGGVAVVLPPGRVCRSLSPLLAALGVLAAAVAVSSGFGGLPLSLALLALGLLAGTALMVITGADAAQGPRAAPAFAALAAGLLLAGLLGAAVAAIQVFQPGWTDGHWIAYSGLAGRAVGNLRQPNHLGSLLLWALVAAVALHELRWLPRAALWAVALPLVLAIELTASRTGAVGLGGLLLWALLDRRLSPTARWMLAATPLLYAVAYLAMGWYGELSQHALGAGARLAAEGGLGELANPANPTGSPNSRLNIWRNTLDLIAAQPWTGVGFGEFNFAWTLTAFPHRPTAFFDHSHNLLLQLAVELGLPAAALVTGLLGWAGWRSGVQARGATGDQGLIARAGSVLVLIAGLHSLVEYPLWYAYFLLPTGLAWGFVLGVRSAPARAAPAGFTHADVAADVATDMPAALPPPRSHPIWGWLAGALMVAAGVYALLDYQHEVVIYAPTAGSASLAERIARGQRSALFGHHADYAAATNSASPASTALGFARGPHALLDTRLMMAWAQYLAERGDAASLDRARWLAQRLREFRNADAEAFFAPCQGGAVLAFQCQAPLRVHDWREFIEPR
jgi:O-antigen ligase